MTEHKKPRMQLFDEQNTSLAPDVFTVGDEGCDVKTVDMVKSDSIQNPLFITRRSDFRKFVVQHRASDGLVTYYECDTGLNPDVVRRTLKRLEQDRINNESENKMKLDLETV